MSIPKNQVAIETLRQAWPFTFLMNEISAWLETVKGFLREWPMGVGQLGKSSGY